MRTRRCPIAVKPPGAEDVWMSARTRSPASMSCAMYSQISSRSTNASDGRRNRSSGGASTLALFAQLPECLLAIDRFHPAALEIVIAAVGSLPDHLFEVPVKGILDNVSRGTSAGRGEIVQFLGCFGRDVHFHTATVRLRKLTGKYSGRLPWPGCNRRRAAEYERAGELPAARLVLPACPCYPPNPPPSTS